MEQIKQLRQMRDEAQARIEALPDYKLVTSLDVLIADLEEAFGSPDDSGEAEDEPSEPAASVTEVAPPEEEETIEAETAARDDEAEEESEQSAAAEEEAAESGASAEPEALAEPEEPAAPEAAADPVSIFDRIRDPAKQADDEPAARFGTNGANGGGDHAEVTPEDEEADAISRAIEELDADLAKTEFGS